MDKRTVQWMMAAIVCGAMGHPYPAWKAACFWKETKKGPTCSTYKKAAIGDLFACGAYENIWQETIGIFFGINY